MTIKLLTHGFGIKEVNCQMNHRVSRRDLRSQLHRLHQYIDVYKAVANLRMRGVKLPSATYRQVAAQQEPGEVYRVPVKSGRTHR